MAYVSALQPSKKDLNEKDEQKATITPTNPFSGQATAAAQTAPTAGRFTNVSSFIKANEGAGQKIASNVQKNIQKDINKASTDQASQIRDAVQGESSRLARAQDLNKQVQEDPTKIAQNTGNLDEFRRLYTNQNISEAQRNQAQEAAQKSNAAIQQASGKVSALGSEQGRFNLLDQAVGRPTYSQGQRRLDQLLFQVGGAQQLQQAQRDLGSAVGERDQALRSLFSTIQSGVGANARAATEAEQLLRGTTSGETNKLTQAQEQEAAALRTDRADMNAAIQQLFTGGFESINVSPDAARNKQIQDKIKAQLAAGNLSLGDRTYNALTGDKWRGFTQTGDVNVQAADVLDQAEFDRYSALATLADLQNRQFSQVGNRGNDSLVKAGDIKQAATAERQSLENTLNQLFTGRGVQTKTRIGGFGSNNGTEQFSYDASANLLDILKEQEGGDGIADVLARYSEAYTPITVGLNTRQDGSIGNPNVDAADALKGAVRQIWEEYQRRLNAGGYSNTLGGITPVRMGQVT